MNSLPKRFIESLNQNDDFSLQAGEIFGGFAIQRAGCGNRVNNRPGQREKENSVPLQLQRHKFSAQSPFFALYGHQQDLCFQLDHIVVASVYDAKLKARSIHIWRNNHVLAESNTCGGTREPSKK